MQSINDNVQQICVFNFLQKLSLNNSTSSLFWSLDKKIAVRVSEKWHRDYEHKRSLIKLWKRLRDIQISVFLMRWTIKSNTSFYGCEKLSVYMWDVKTISVQKRQLQQTKMCVSGEFSESCYIDRSRTCFIESGRKSQKHRLIHPSKHSDNFECLTCATLLTFIYAFIVSRINQFASLEVQVSSEDASFSI